MTEGKAFELKTCADCMGAIVMHELRPATKMVGVRLLRYVNGTLGRAWPSQARLAAELGMHVATVDKALAELVSAGLFHRYSGKGLGQKVTTQYEPIVSAILAVNTRHTAGIEAGEPGGNTRRTAGIEAPVSRHVAAEYPPHGVRNTRRTAGQKTNERVKKDESGRAVRPRPSSAAPPRRWSTRDEARAQPSLLLPIPGGGGRSGEASERPALQPHEAMVREFIVAHVDAVLWPEVEALIDQPWLDEVAAFAERCPAASRLAWGHHLVRVLPMPRDAAWYVSPVGHRRLRRVAEAAA